MTRIIDESGEGYRYHASSFIPIKGDRELQAALRITS